MRRGIVVLALAALLCGCAQEGLTLEDPQDPRFVPPGTVVREPPAGTEPVLAAPMEPVSPEPAVPTDPVPTDPVASETPS